MDNLIALFDSPAGKIVMAIYVQAYGRSAKAMRSIFLSNAVLAEYFVNACAYELKKAEEEAAA